VKKIFVVKFTKNNGETTRSDRQKVTSHLGGGDTRVKAIKSDSDSDSDEQKRLPGFQEKNRGVTPSVAAPGVTHPSDATTHYTLTFDLRLLYSP